MSQQQLAFVYPGDLTTRTGGYRYDKRIMEAMAQGNGNIKPWDVSLISLDGDYPFPVATQLQSAAARFDAIADDTITVVDGLAFSVMPQIIARHSSRLNIVALIHHPLALETGLDATQAAQLKALETQALHFANHVITTSELTASSLKEYEVPAHKVTAVLPGTDVATIAQGSHDDTLNFLCVATITQRKGHRVLLEALASLVNLSWHLRCVGSTERDLPNYHALIDQCKELAITDRVSFVGEVGDESLDRFYSEADVFVLPSFHEGYGMVLSEAIARGLPIICSDAGAMSQTVPEGAGILVPPDDQMALADAIGQFINDEQLQSRLKQAALAARKQLRSWQTAADEFSQILAQLECPSVRNV